VYPATIKHIALAITANVLLTGYVPGAYIGGIILIVGIALCAIIILAIAIEIYQRVKGVTTDRSVINSVGRVLFNILTIVICLFILSIVWTTGNSLINIARDTIAGKYPRITVTTSSGKIRLRVPLNEFWESNYRRDKFGVFQLDVNGRKVNVATTLTHNTVSNSYISKFNKYELVSAGEIYGLHHYKENDQPVYMMHDYYIPTDETLRFGVSCANSTGGYMFCNRISKRDFDSAFRYSYRIEPEELAQWYEIEQEVSARISGYIIE